VRRRRTPLGYLAADLQKESFRATHGCSLAPLHSLGRSSPRLSAPPHYRCSPLARAPGHREGSLTPPWPGDALLEETHREAHLHPLEPPQATDVGWTDLQLYRLCHSIEPRIIAFSCFVSSSSVLSRVFRNSWHHRSVPCCSVESQSSSSCGTGSPLSSHCSKLWFFSFSKHGTPMCLWSPPYLLLAAKSYVSSEPKLNRTFPFELHSVSPTSYFPFFLEPNPFKHHVPIANKILD
jgi:hypothetical protein